MPRACQALLELQPVYSWAPAHLWEVLEPKQAQWGSSRLRQSSVSHLPAQPLVPSPCPCPGCWSLAPSRARTCWLSLDPLLQYDEDAMVEAVGKHNPVSFAFEVTSDFMHYRKGVYSK